MKSVSLILMSGCRPGVLPEKLGWGVRPISLHSNPIYDQKSGSSLPYLEPDQKYETLFTTVAVGTVSLNKSYDGFLLMFL